MKINLKTLLGFLLHTVLKRCKSWCWKRLNDDTSFILSLFTCHSRRLFYHHSLSIIKKEIEAHTHTHRFCFFFSLIIYDKDYVCVCLFIIINFQREIFQVSPSISFILSPSHKPSFSLSHYKVLHYFFSHLVLFFSISSLLPLSSLLSIGCLCSLDTSFVYRFGHHCLHL